MVFEHNTLKRFDRFPQGALPAGAQDNFAKSRRGAIAAHRAEFGLSKALSGL